MRAPLLLPAMIAVAAALGSVLPRPAPASPPDAPAWEAGSHFTATLHQRSGLWRLHPADGHDLAVTVPAACGDLPAIPQGVWLLVHRADGLALAAPSTVALPAGHLGEVALRGCGQQGDALHLPAPLMELLAEHTGAIHVAD